MIYYIYFNKHMLLIQLISYTTYRASQLPDLHILKYFYHQGPIKHINYFEIFIKTVPFSTKCKKME